MIEKKRKRGRPKLAPDELKKTIFSIRLSPEERAAIEGAAKLIGVRASDWARSVLLEACQRRQS